MGEVVLFTGSRVDLGEYLPGWVLAAIKEDLGTLAPDDVVVHGGARGVDLTVDLLARSVGIHVARVDALWGGGRSAGPRRNRAMLVLGPARAFAYPWRPRSRGTRGMVELLRGAGIPVVVRESAPVAS